MAYMDMTNAALVKMVEKQAKRVGATVQCTGHGGKHVNYEVTGKDGTRAVMQLSYGREAEHAEAKCRSLAPVFGNGWWRR